MQFSDLIKKAIIHIGIELDTHMKSNDGYITEEDAARIKTLMAIVTELFQNQPSSAEMKATLDELKALRDELELEKKGLDEDYDELKADYHGLITVFKALRADQDELRPVLDVSLVERNELVAEKLALIAKQGVLTRLHFKKINN